MWSVIAIVFVVLFLLVAGYLSMPKWTRPKWKVFCSGDVEKVRMIQVMGNGKLYCLHHYADTSRDDAICTKYSTLDNCKKVLNAGIGGKLNESDGDDTDWRTRALADADAAPWWISGTKQSVADPLDTTIIV